MEENYRVHEGKRLVVQFPDGVIKEGVARVLQSYVDRVLEFVEVGGRDSGYMTVADVMGDERITLKLDRCEGEGRRSRSFDFAGKQVGYNASDDWIDMWGEGEGLHPDDFQRISATVAALGLRSRVVGRGSIQADDSEVNELYRRVINMVGEDWRQRVDDYTIRSEGEPSLIREGGDMTVGDE